MLKHLMIIFLILATTTRIILGQESQVTVPDLTGLSVPAATTLLNRNGLRLGNEINEGWTAESGYAQNTISAQAIPAGSLIPSGSAIEVTVLRSANAFLIYDDNDLTLVNRTGSEIDLTGISFRSIDGTPAGFNGGRWAGRLRDTQCAQVWSVGRNGPKGLDECTAIQNWLVTTNSSEHFWTGAGGTSSFIVSQYGVDRANCFVSVPGRCDFYLSGGSSAGDSTPYIYFAYTTDRLALINNSTDQWMTLNDFNIFNNNPALAITGQPIAVGDPTLYGVRSPVANLQQLAPGQCLLFTNSLPESENAPQSCDIVGRLDIATNLIFWAAAFDFVSQSDGQRRSCPAANPDGMTICVMPR